MSLQQPNGTFVVNPLTKRLIKVGSRVWINLVKQGMIDGNEYEDPKELYNVVEGDNVDEKINELNKELSIHEQSVRGRG